MRFTRHDALPYALALAILSVVYVAYAGPQRNGPISILPLLHARTTASGASCGLPVGKQVQAVKAFAEMLPVFRHARCANCHGDFDIRSTDQHSGAVAANASKLDPRATLTVPQRVTLHQGCGTCHSQVEGKAVRRGLTDSTVLTGWMVPPEPMLWVGKDDEQLCILVKSFEENADSFVSHVRSDHGEIQFLKAAFEGKRALDSATMDLYDVVQQKPPSSLAELISQGSRWARLVDDHWKDSPECGCVMPKIKLKVQHIWTSDTPGGVPSRESSDAQFEAKLEPVGDDRPNYFQGEISHQRVVDMTLPSFCSGKGFVTERWRFTAFLDPESGSVRVWHTRIPQEPTGEIVCRQGGGTARMGIDPGVVAGLLGAGEMVIPADSTSKKVQAAMLNVRESLAITVLEVPGK